MKALIKKIINIGNYSNQISFVLLLLRLTVGFFMIANHGAGKFSKLLSDEPIQFADPIGVGVTASFYLAVFAEVICSILLILGLATRLAVFPLLITMLVVVFIIHGSDGLGRQELPFIYSAIYFSILISGAGKYSIDNLISKK
ncbi:MAG: DoxX family protein [Bacteroidetes bacterium]|nr:DoxX family protein [Bacteroidota bacterium]